MQRGRGMMGGAGPVNRPFGRGMRGTYGGGGGPPTNMMRMDDSGLSFVMLMILVAAEMEVAVPVLANCTQPYAWVSGSLVARTLDLWLGGSSLIPGRRG